MFSIVIPPKGKINMIIYMLNKPNNMEYFEEKSVFEIITLYMYSILYEKKQPSLLDLYQLITPTSSFTKASSEAFKES